MITMQTIRLLFTMLLSALAGSSFSMPTMQAGSFAKQREIMQISCSSKLSDFSVCSNFPGVEVSSCEKIEAAESAVSLFRPYIRVATREAVESNALKIGDKFVDANTGKLIEGGYNLGHKYGHEFYKYKAWGEAEGLTQNQFNNLMNNSNLYQIEDPISNMSHFYEAPADVFYGVGR